jgi:hypothetical protein
MKSQLVLVLGFVREVVEQHGGNVAVDSEKDADRNLVLPFQDSNARSIQTRLIVPRQFCAPQMHFLSSA